MHPGTSLWAIKQLFDGKKVTLRSWRDCDYIYIVDNKIVDFEGNPFSIREFDTDRYTWQLWTPPNPYPVGTFAWAWEELVRGNKVEVSVFERSHRYRLDANGDLCEDYEAKNSVKINFVNVALIKSTNWKLV